MLCPGRPARLDSRRPLAYPAAVLAVALTLCSAFFFAAGHALQKRGVALRLAGLPEGAPAAGALGWLAAMAREPLWAAGFLSVLLASGLDLQAVALGDLTLVKPLLGLQAAFAVAIGVGLLGERVGRGEGAAIVLLVAGAALVAATAAPGEARAPEGWSGALVFGAAAGLALGVVAFHRSAPARLGGESAFGLAAGLMFGVSDFMMKRATSVVAAGGDLFSVLDVGSWIALVRTPEVLWIVLANLGAFTLMQLAWARGRVAVISPLATLSGTAFAVALGFAALGETFSATRGAGIALVLIGTAGLVRGGSSPAPTGAGRGPNVIHGEPRSG